MSVVKHLYYNGALNKRDGCCFSYKIPIAMRVENYLNVMHNPPIFPQMLVLMWEDSQLVMDPISSMLRESKAFKFKSKI